MHYDRNKAAVQGRIEVICGVMFSGKTEELIRRLNRARIARQKVEVFKPIIDRRYNEDSVVSHDSKELAATALESASQILLYAGDAHVIGIDEAQFFDDGLPEVCNKLANQGVRVIVAGLDMDFQGKPFGTMPHLLSIAEDITKVHAVCMHCGGEAMYSHRTQVSDEQVLIGAAEAYLPLCRSCYQVKKNY